MNYVEAIENAKMYDAIIGRKWNENDLLNKFKLIGVDKKIYSNTITIIIYMFSKKD